MTWKRGLALLLVVPVMGVIWLGLAVILTMGDEPGSSVRAAGGRSLTYYEGDWHWKRDPALGTIVAEGVVENSGISLGGPTMVIVLFTDAKDHLVKSGRGILDVEPLTTGDRSSWYVSAVDDPRIARAEVLFTTPGGTVIPKLIFSRQ